MKVHIGSLTAQNPIGELLSITRAGHVCLISRVLGKFPPAVIIENPDNLHSETITTVVPGQNEFHAETGNNLAGIFHDLLLKTLGPIYPRG